MDYAVIIPSSRLLQFSVLFSLVLMALPATAQTPGAVPALPCSFSAEMSPVIPGVADSLAAHIDRARTIVVAQARAVAIQGEGPATDSYGDGRNRLIDFVATQTLKGSSDLKRFELFQKWAPGFFLVTPGQRFIVFLGEPSATGKPDLPRYDIDPQSDKSGFVCIEGNRVFGDFNTYHFSGAYDRGASYRPPSPNYPTFPELLVDDIRYLANTVRASGRTVVESGRSEDTNGLTLTLVPVDAPRGQTIKVLSGLQVTRTSPLYRLSIRLRFRPVTLADIGTISYSGPPRGLAQAGPFPKTELMQADGSFSVRLTPGIWRAEISGTPLGYYVKSISAGASDLLRDTLRVTAEGVADIVVTMTDQSPDPARGNRRISGRVVGMPQNLPADTYRGLRVVLASTKTGDPSNPIQTVPAKDGTFEFQRIPPGQYSVTLMKAASAVELVTSQDAAAAERRVHSRASVEVETADVSVELSFSAGVN